MNERLLFSIISKGSLFLMWLAIHLHNFCLYSPSVRMLLCEGSDMCFICSVRIIFLMHISSYFYGLSFRDTTLETSFISLLHYGMLGDRKRIESLILIHYFKISPTNFTLLSTSLGLLP